MQVVLTSLLVLLPLAGCATSIFQAAESGDVDRVRDLVEEQPSLVDAMDARTLTALHYAAAEGHADVVRALLERGADANNTALGGVTPLFVAAAGGHAEVVALLLDSGARPDGRTPWNPLRVAASEGHPRVVEALLSGGASPEGHNVPPLMAAAAAGSIESMELLVAAGAKVNRVTLDDFSSALTVAAAQGQVAAVEWLVSHGADLHHDDAHGRTALRLAEENGHPNVADVLRRAGAE